MPPIIFNSCLQQSFLLPDTVIYNITQKPSNPKVYRKLIQTCKYFFAKNPLLVFHCLWHRLDEKWITCSTTYCSSYKRINFNQAATTKIWATKYLAVWSDYVPPRIFQPRNIASSFFTRLYKYDDTVNLNFFGQIIYDTELLLFRKLEKLSMNKTTVLSKNNSVIPVEKILQYFPKLDGFQFIKESSVPAITSNTVKEILKNPNLHKFQFFILENIPECFDIDTFYEYIKKNDTTQFHFDFSQEISKEFQHHHAAFTDEILENEDSTYIIPYFRFPKLKYYKQENLRERLTLKTYKYNEFF